MSSSHNGHQQRHGYELWQLCYDIIWWFRLLKLNTVLQWFQVVHPGVSQEVMPQHKHQSRSDEATLVLWVVQSPTSADDAWNITVFSISPWQFQVPASRCFWRLLQLNNTHKSIINPPADPPWCHVGKRSRSKHHHHALGVLGQKWIRVLFPLLDSQGLQVLQAGQCGFTLQTLCRATLAWRLGWDGWDWWDSKPETGGVQVTLVSQVCVGTLDQTHDLAKRL